MIPTESTQHPVVQDVADTARVRDSGWHLVVYGHGLCVSAGSLRDKLPEEEDQQRSRASSQEGLSSVRALETEIHG